MKISLVAGEPSGQPCTDCSVRQFSLCAALDKAELRELEHLGRHIHFGSCETVFAQEEMTTSFYNLLEGVMRLYKLLPDGRRQIVGFALPGDFLGMTASPRHSFSADAIGPVAICRFSRAAFARFVEDKSHLLRRINELAVRELSQAQDHMVLLGRRSAEEKVATFLIGWRDRLARLDRLDEDGAVADEPPGHRRLSRPDHRNRQPYLHQARTRRGDRDPAGKRLRCWIPRVPRPWRPPRVVDHVRRSFWAIDADQRPASLPTVRSLQ